MHANNIRSVFLVNFFIMASLEAGVMLPALKRVRDKVDKVMEEGERLSFSVKDHVLQARPICSVEKIIAEIEALLDRFMWGAQDNFVKMLDSLARVSKADARIMLAEKILELHKSSARILFDFSSTMFCEERYLSDIFTKFISLSAEDKVRFEPKLKELCARQGAYAQTLYTLIALADELLLRN